MEPALKWCAYIGLLVLAVCLFIQKGVALQCYICNSHLHGDDCRYLPEDKRDMYKQTCENLKGNKTYTYCRKMFQDLKGEHRYIRQCGTMGEDGCVRRSGTRNVHIIYCHCKEDLCNQGNKPLPQLTPYISVAMATYFLPGIYRAFRG